MTSGEQKRYGQREEKELSAVGHLLYFDTWGGPLTFPTQSEGGGVWRNFSLLLRVWRRRVRIRIWWLRF